MTDEAFFLGASSQPRSQDLLGRGEPLGTILAFLIPWIVGTAKY